MSPNELPRRQVDRVKPYHGDVGAQGTSDRNEVSRGVVRAPQELYPCYNNPMKIAVCLKQVPDTSDIKWSAENTIIREGLLSILNPVDDYALELAREVEGAEITAITMGPLMARAVLEYAIARGCNEVILLSDKKFTGSDTLATAKVLSKALSGFDLILCAKSAIDGETGQVPPSTAQLLGIEFVSNICEIISIKDNEITLKQKNEDGFTTISANLPLVASVVESDFEITPPKIQDYIRAQQKEIKILGAAELGIDESSCGTKGSPTMVSKVFRPVLNRSPKAVEGDFADFILKKIGGEG